jgi:ribulose-phosphate 3-epimerase
MISEPGKYFEDFVTDKTGFITFHQEAETHMNSTIQRIKAAGIGAGVAINPATPIWTLDEVMEDVDLILVMSVNPGFGGQKLIPSTLKKVRKLIEIREKNGFDWQIEIDGGVNDVTGAQLAQAGADILVAGSYVFGADDPIKTIEGLKNL